MWGGGGGGGGGVFVCMIYMYRCSYESKSSPTLFIHCLTHLTHSSVDTLDHFDVGTLLYICKYFHGVCLYKYNAHMYIVCGDFHCWVQNSMI